MKAEHKVVAVALILCLLLWLVHAFLVWMATSDVSYLQMLVLDVPQRAAFMRSLMTAFLLGFALFVSYHVRIRREACELAERSGAELEQVFQTATDAIRIVDADYTILRANEAFAKMVGRPIDEIVGEKCHEVFGCEDCDTPLCHLRRIMNGERIEQHEGTRTTAGGEIICLLSAAPFEDAGGAIIGMVESFRDISELTRMHERVKKSEERYRKLAETSPDLILVLGPGAIIRYANPHSAELIERATGDDAVGKSLLDVVVEDERERLRSGVEAVLEGSWESFGDIVRFQAATGDDDTQQRSYRVRGIDIDYDDRPGVLFFAHDITDLLQAQQQVQAERDRAQRYLDIAGTIILVLSPEGRVELINRYGCELLGVDEEEIIGADWFENFLPGDVGEEARERLELMIAGEKETGSEMVNPIVTTDGERRITSWDARPLKDDNGEITAVLTSGRDITERRRALERFRAEEERLRVTLQSIGDAVIATDIHGHLQLMNDVAAELTGWNEEEAKDLPLDGILNLRVAPRDMTTSEMTSSGPDDNGEAADNPVPHVLSEKEVVESTEPVLMISRNGDRRLIEYSAAPIGNGEQNRTLGAVLVLRDVTQRAQLYREMQRQAKLQSVGVLAGGIAHDFNNLLTAILGNIDLARLLSDSPQQLKEKLEEAENAVMHARDLTQQLLTFSSGGAPVTEVIPVRELLDNAVMLSLSGSTTRCEIDIDDSINALEVDASQARQVISSLLINADQAMPEGGVVTVRARNHQVRSDDVSPLDPGSYVHFTISDTGPGVQPGDSCRIFEPYFTTKEDAAGLGLAVAYSITDRHGGHLELESMQADPDAQQGATFHLYLPASSEPPVAKEKDTGEMQHGEGRILIMDDDVSILNATSRLMDHLGYEAELATDGQEAIDRYTEALENGTPFDAVIMDLTIPGGMGGAEAVKQLCEIDENVRAIVSSGYSNDPIMADYEKYGFCAVLAKPYQARQLASTLREVLNETDETEE
ncbi:MAG: PAS domain-containing protein [Armatimonadota bacterium]